MLGEKARLAEVVAASRPADRLQQLRVDEGAQIAARRRPAIVSPAVSSTIFLYAACVRRKP